MTQYIKTVQTICCYQNCNKYQIVITQEQTESPEKTQMDLQNNGFINKEGLKQLNQYKYVSGGCTKLDYIMNPFWQKIVSFMPLTIAPNTITFSGAIMIIIAEIIMLCHTTKLDGDIPSWCFLFNAIAIFLYQTLDAIDGKQARRTKSSSPLGQLFDHGCDSFTMGFIFIGICHAGKISGFPAVFLAISSQFVFWASNWVQHHTGVLNTKYGQLGVTQGQLIAALLHLITAAFGQNFWRVKMQNALFFIELPSELSEVSLINFLATILSVIAFLSMAIGILITIFKSKKGENPGGAYKVSKKAMLNEHTTLIIIFVLELFWTDLNIYKKYEALILLNFGAFLSLLVCKTIISTTTKMTLKHLHNEVIYFLFFTMLLSFFDIVGQYQAMKITFGICLAVNFLRISIFVKGVIKQITQYLGIYCFSLQKRNQKVKADYW